MEQNEFNLRCAKRLGIFYSNSDEVFVVHEGETMPGGFDPYFDANDRNMVLEDMKIETRYFYDDRRWICLVSGGVGVQDESMGIAQRKCIAAVLK